MSDGEALEFLFLLCWTCPMLANGVLSIPVSALVFTLAYLSSVIRDNLSP